VNGAADVVTDLERGTLPFDDRSFETVVAADVLEHVDSMHAFFDELCRVADRHVIVSLPNPYRNFALCRVGPSRVTPSSTTASARRRRRSPQAGSSARTPMRFLETRCERNGFEVEQIDAEDMGFPEEVRKALPGLAPTFQLAAGTLWCVATRRTA
jgi:hypothetical protein